MLQMEITEMRHPSGATIAELLAQHERERLDAINLIVSENRMTERARSPLSSDIQSRYAASFYAGTGPAQAIVERATESAKQVFGVEHANLSPISGNVSLLSVVFALTQPGDRVGRVPPFFPGGGYPLHYEMFHREPLPLPFCERTWQLDLPKTLDLLDAQRPPLVVLGSSIVMYPFPVREVADVVHRYGGIVAYDGSHTLGLIAGGQYQQPLAEGADLLLGSTHKTFPGPQGGLILTNDADLARRVERLANFTPLNGPTMICNPHLARIASTGIVLEETPWAAYAGQVVANARTIAEALRAAGIPIHGMYADNFPELTYCHQVITNYRRNVQHRLRDRLHSFRINTDGFVRLGTGEITRLGYRERESRKLGEVLAALLSEQPIDEPEIRDTIASLIAAHPSVVL